jgi:acetyl-CoA synthetase
MNDKSLQSVMQEERSFPPQARFAATAHPNAAELALLREQAGRDSQEFWAEQARRELVWHKPFTHTLDESAAPNYRWFTDGQLNVSYNCLDHHLAASRDHLALVFEAEDGKVRKLTYGQLHAEVCRFGNALRALGVQQGDRVVIYMPLVPEAIVAMRRRRGVSPSGTVWASALPPPLGVPRRVTLGLPFRPARKMSVALKHLAFIRTTTGFEYW